MLREVSDDDVVVDSGLQGVCHALPREGPHERIGKDDVAADELVQDCPLQWRRRVRDHLHARQEYLIAVT